MYKSKINENLAEIEWYKEINKAFCDESYNKLIEKLIEKNKSLFERVLSYEEKLIELSDIANTLRMEVSTPPPHN